MLSSDAGEGFPNVVAEAMACERPVAATDSGDVRLIVGEAGRVVPPRQPEALGDAVLELLEALAQPGHDVRRAARARIVGEFSVEALVRRSIEVLTEVHAAARART